MRVFAILALALAVGLAAAVSPIASSSPDGLQRVATDNGFVVQQRHHDALAPGYAFPGIDDPTLATGMSGFAGTLLVFGLGCALAAVRRRPAPA